MLVLKFIVFTLATIIGAFLLSLMLILAQFMSVFYNHRCHRCGHRMDYKGLKEDNSNGHYLFHCTKCGAWKEMPAEDLFRRIKE